MSEPVYDYYATRIVQDLEDDLYESKERIQRLRRQNDELTAENERLRDGVQDIRRTCARTADICRSSEYPEEQAVAGNLESVAHQLAQLLDGDTE